MYYVRVAESYRWNHARVAGRNFAKQAATPIDEATITDEILESPILAVEYVSDQEGTDGGPRRKERSRRRDGRV